MGINRVYYLPFLKKSIYPKLWKFEKLYPIHNPMYETPKAKHVLVFGFKKQWYVYELNLKLC
jgi:hypothetical protein